MARLANIDEQSHDVSHLCKPRQDDHHGRDALLVVPKDVGCRSPLCLSHRVIHPSTDSNRLLCSRIGHPLTVMWRIHPPHDGKEERPSRRKHVIDEKEMCEIERLLGIFLFLFRKQMEKSKAKRDLNHTNKDGIGGEVEKTDLLDCLESPSESDQTEEGVQVQT